MKIMIAIDNYFAHYYIRRSFARALQFSGHDVVLWDISKKNVFDAFDEFEPDVFFGQTFNLNPPLIKCIKERPNLKVIMKASDWGHMQDKMDAKKYPVLKANQQEVDMVMDLYEYNQQPNLLYVHYHKDRLKDTHGYWMSGGLKVSSLMNAADIFEFTKGEAKDEYTCDIGFVGGRWGYKSITLDKYLIPLMQPDRGVGVKIFGNQPWGLPQYCGFLPDGEVRHFLRSAKICPNLSEPHSQDFGYDIVERPFKLLSNKCFVISDYVEDLHKLFPNEIVYAKTPESFHRKVEEWLNKPQKDRDEKAEAGYEKVINSHTYFHRMHDIFKAALMETEAEHILNKLEEAKGQMEL